MLKEFKAFAMRGNVADLAIGVVIGTAFGAIVSSLVGDIIMPVIGIMTGGLDFSGMIYRAGDAVVSYGKFIQATFVFLVVAFTLFLAVKGMNALKKKESEGQPETVSPPADIALLTEIRDLLRK